MRVAINGFGRIGRAFLRCAYTQAADLEIVAINDLEDASTNAQLLSYDSIYRHFPAAVTPGDEVIEVAGRQVRSLTQPDPLQLPWEALEIDVVIEATGRFTSRALAAQHLRAGASKVLISANATGPVPVDATVVLGANFDEVYDRERHDVLSAGSCTTNCLAPLVKVIHQAVGIRYGQMTAVHAYTGDQRLLDGAHRDPRRARSAPLNLVPTSTGATAALGLVLPELAGRIDGYALRVPTPTGSLLDLSVETEADTDASALNAAIAARAEQADLTGILAYTTDPYVSSDVIGSSYSAVFDSGMTSVVGAHQARVLAWYDNEWGYASRLVDLATRLL